jgi:hypothetical protein
MRKIKKCDNEIFKILKIKFNFNLIIIFKFKSVYVKIFFNNFKLFKSKK